MVSRYVSNFALGIGPGPGNPNGHPPTLAPMPLGVAMAATAAAAAAAAAVPLSTVTQTQPTQPPSSSQQQQSQGGGGGVGGQPTQQPPHASQSLKGPLQQPPPPQNPQTPAEYHVQQCLMSAGTHGANTSQPPPPPHQHYRILHSRSDGYVAAPSPGFSAPQSGPPHQGPPVIRGMQSAPPSATQQELSKMQQQPIYGGGSTPGTVRPNQQGSIYRSTSTPTPRAPRHVAMQPQLFQQQMVMQPHYYPRQPASQIFSPQYFSPPQMAPNFAYGGPYYVPANYVPQHRSNAVSGGIVPQTGATLVAGSGASQAQILSTNVLAGAGTATGQSGTGQSGTGQATGTNNRKKRKYALDIIDPYTHKNVLDDLEMSKNQNSTAPEVDYTEQMNLQANNDVLGPPPQVIDSTINSDPNFNSKTSQGMVFVDMMQQRKISAIPASCQNQVNEMIAPTTPVVSAMSDAPSVDIHHKSQTKKKNRILETIPQQSTQIIEGTDKISSDNSKISLTDSSGGSNLGDSSHISNVNDGISEKCSQQQQQQQITTTVNSSNLPSLVSRTSEDVSMNKAINRIDTENSSVSTSSVHHSSNVVGSSTSSSSNIDSRDQILINSSGGGGGGVSSSVVVGGGVNSNKTGVLTNSNNISTNNSSSGVISSNHQQQQQQQNSSTQHSQQAVQSVTSSNQQQHSQTEHKQQQPLPKRDIKTFQHNKPVSQQHQQQQQHSQQSSLPSSANNNNSPSTISNFIVNNTSNSNISQSSSNNKSFSPSLSSSSSTTSSSPYPSNNSSQTTSTNLQSMPVVVPTPSAPSTGTSGQQSSAATLPTKGVSVSAVDSNSASNSNSGGGGSNTAAMPSSATTKSSHKGKDKIQQQHYHSQQQQHQTTTTNSNNNNLAGIDTSSSVVTNSKNLQEKQNSVNNNLQQSSVTMATIVDNKMKLNEKDELCGANSKQKMLSSDHHSVFHSNQGSPQALDETDRVGSINEKSSKLVDEINNYCNNNNKPYNTVTDNTTNNNVTSKSKSIPPNDKETSNSRMQQQQKSAVVSKDSNKMNSSNSGSSSSNNNISNSIKGETANNKSTADTDIVAYKEKSSNDSCKRDSNNSTSTASGDTLSPDTTATITNGTATPVSGPLSPPPSNNSITNDTEKILPPAHVSLIQYNAGQWSPSNPEGAKIYDRNQLLNLRNSPASKAKPDLKNEVASIVLQGNRSAQLQPSLMPPFARGGMGNKGVRSIGGTSNMSLGGGGMSGSQTGNMYMKQSSMSGVNMKNNSKGSKSGVIHLSLSLREDVKLNESENAWRPAHLKQNDNLPPEERSKDEVIRRVRGILNKLTPEKFETLVEQIMVLQIDTKEKVISVMELVFEKAIDEPNFSASYAKLCSRIADNKLKSDIKCKDENAIAQQKASNMTAFKSALLDKTQHEFVANVSNCDAKNTKLKPLMETIATCTDPEKKLELEATLEEEERKIRRRSGGTVRFIGELFKINMLTIKIIRDCINNLLDPSSEDKLECLCKLLTTVGKKFESSPEKDGISTNLESVFAKMKNIVDRKIETKISSRVRFMLQDVIDLRKNKWNSTKTDANPKTMEQIQKEIKTEQMSSQYGNFNLMSNKKDDRRYGGASSGGGLMSFGGGSGGGSGGGGGGGGGGYYKSNRQQQSGEETWYTQPSKGNRAVDTSKLGQMFNTDIDNGTKLGGMSKFQWNQTSGTLGSTTTTSNQFAALSSLDSNKNISVGPRNKGSYNKGSMERDRYGSTHGSRESSSSRTASRGGVNDKDKDRDQDRDTGRGSMQRNVPSSHHSYGSSSSSATVPSKSNKSPVTMPQSLSGSTLTSATSRYDISTGQASSQQDIFEKPDSKMSGNIKKNVKKMITVAYEETFNEAVPYLLSCPEKCRWYCIYALFYDYLHSTKVTPIHRKVTSDFVSFLFHQNLITLKQFMYAYEEFCEVADDIIIDVPALFRYIFQFVGPFIYKGDLTIKNFWNNKLFENKLGQKFLQDMISYFICEVGPNNTRKLWRNSDLKWTDFLPDQDVAKFIKDNKFEFIDSENCKPPITGTTDLQRIRDRLKELLNETTKVDDIFDYLEGNIVNIENIDKQFIRALTETLCEYAINEKTNKLDTKKFQKICLPILQRYLNLKEDRELECLYAIQYLINKLEHPSGLLNEIFAELYEAETVAADTFIKWRDSKEEPAGKGVAVKGLNSFFLNLTEEEAGEENN